MTQSLRFLIATLTLYLICTLNAWAQHPNGRIELNNQITIVGDVPFRECEISYLGRDRKVQCTYVSVAENPNNPTGKKLSLFVARIPAKRQSKAQNDPMLFLAGGPGQAASEAFLFSDHIYSDLARTRDFYLIDQRGTGKSNPLNCPDTQARFSEIYVNQNEDYVIDYTTTCLAELDGSPQFYTTENTVVDFEAVRKALKINQWNLLGVSYGTRVATHYIRRHPDAIRTAVLDSVVPPQQVLGSQLTQHSQLALDKLIQRCAEAKPCNESLPDLEKEINTLLIRLKANPVNVRFENFTSGKMQSMELTREHINSIIRMYLYNPHAAAILPPVLHEASINEHYAPLARMSYELVEKFNETLNVGLHNSIICNEEYPFTPIKSAISKQTSYLEDSLDSALQAMCSVWPKSYVPMDMKQPLESTVPALLFSGEYDPITPPQFAEQTRQQFSNAIHYTLKGQGHNVTPVGCAPHLINLFVQSAAVEDINSTCLTRISESPLFINFNGTAP